jgi:hypothetical protein
MVLGDDPQHVAAQYIAARTKVRQHVAGRPLAGSRRQMEDRLVDVADDRGKTSRCLGQDRHDLLHGQRTTWHRSSLRANPTAAFMTVPVIFATQQF